MSRWLKKIGKSAAYEDKALAIIAASSIGEIINLDDFAEKRATNPANLDTPIDQLHDHINSYLMLCEERSASNPNAELGFLTKIAQYKIASNDLEKNIQSCVKRLLLIDAALDEDAIQYFPLHIRKQHFNEFSERFLGLGHEFGNILDPNLRTDGSLMTWEEMMSNRINVVAGTITKQMMSKAEQTVYSSHGMNS